MRIHKAALTAAVVAVTMGATACGETGTPLTAPEEAVSLQRNIAGQVTAGNLIAALNNIAVQINALNNIRNLEVDVRVVNIEDLNLNVAQNRILTNFLNNNNVEIDVLRQALQNFLNNNTVEVLNNADIVITDVVAVSVLSGGDIIIFQQ